MREWPLHGFRTTSFRWLLAVDRRKVTRYSAKFWMRSDMHKMAARTCSHHRRVLYRLLNRRDAVDWRWIVDFNCKRVAIDVNCLWRLPACMHVFTISVIFYWFQFTTTFKLMSRFVIFTVALTHYHETMKKLNWGKFIWFRQLRLEKQTEYHRNCCRSHWNHEGYTNINKKLINFDNKSSSGNRSPHIGGTTYKVCPSCLDRNFMNNIQKDIFNIGRESFIKSEIQIANIAAAASQ